MRGCGSATVPTALSAYWTPPTSPLCSRRRTDRVRRRRASGVAQHRNQHPSDRRGDRGDFHQRVPAGTPKDAISLPTRDAAGVGVQTPSAELPITEQPQFCSAASPERTRRRGSPLRELWSDRHRGDCDDPPRELDGRRGCARLSDGPGHRRGPAMGCATLLRQPARHGVACGDRHGADPATSRA